MKKLTYLFFSFLIVVTSCTTADLDPSLEQSKDAANGITQVNNLYAVIKGAYNRMTATGYYGRDIIINGDVRTPNCFSNGNSGRFITQAAFEYSPLVGYFWDEAYQVISSANIVIDTDLSTLDGDQDYGMHLKGQAYAIRALTHFDLLKEYGQMHVGGDLGVPYIDTYLSGASSEAELFQSRGTIADNLSKIYADLETAYDLMEETGDKVFFTKSAAKAIESRVALYFGEYQRALDAANAVINTGSYSILDASGFVASFAGKRAGNSIFELAYSPTDNNGINGTAYIYRGASYGDVQVVDGIELLFEEGDVRGLGGILGYEDLGAGPLLRNMGKYPNNQDNNNRVLLRVEEMYLNAAEALLQLGQADQALEMLNLIPTNRGAAAYSEATMDNILLERRKEFMFEGYYYHDLLRTGQGIVKESFQQVISETIPYGDHRLAWAIPQAEMDANSNMSQNPGYQ